MAEINDLNVTDAGNTARWPEGMAPSAVNNAGRADEGLLARWHKDTNGSLIATGLVNVFAVAANQTLSAYYDGLVIAFEANLTNTGSATLNVDAVAAATIKKHNDQDLIAGDIEAGQKVVVIYDGTNWQMVSPAAQGSLPALGAVGNAVVSNGAAPVYGAAGVHGTCRLTKSGATLLLSGQDGRWLNINGQIEEVPTAGVTLAATALTIDTDHFIYAYMNVGVMTLEASTTGHSTDTTTGVEIKTGDSTRTLVGMARPITGPVWVDTDAQRFVISYFNRRNISGQAHFTTGRTTTSGTFVELNSEIRANFLVWADEAVHFRFNGSMTVNALTSITAGIGVDGATAEDSYEDARHNAVNHPHGFGISFYKSGLSEGFHFLTGLGKVGTGTGTWPGSGTAGLRCTTGVMIRG